MAVRGYPAQSFVNGSFSYELIMIFLFLHVNTMSRRPKALRGGKAANKSRKDFDAEQLLFGTMVEMEHTNNPHIAEFIAMDHLAEYPDYYFHLAQMEFLLDRSNNSTRKATKSRGRAKSAGSR